MAARRYPAIPRGSIADDIQAITEILDIGLGIRGDPLDRFLTWQDLLDKGIAKVIPDKVRRNGITDDAIGDGNPAPTRGTPPAPQGFQVSDGISSISMAWTDPNTLYDNHSLTEIWRHTSDNLANAVLVGRTGGVAYTDPVGEISEARYYWIRFVSRAGVKGPFNSASGTVGYTVGVLTEMITGSIGFDNLETSLADSLTDVFAGFDDLKTQYMVKIDNDGFVAGFGLYNLGPDDNGFMIRADKFAIASPSLTDDVRYPFLVGFAGGEWRVIVDGNIMTDTLTVGSVSGSLQSTNWDGGATGWKIDEGGDVTFNSGTFRGTVTAATIESSDISGTDISGGTITGSMLQTGISGQRIVISNSSNDLVLYDADDNPIAKIGTESFEGQPTTLIVGLDDPMTFGAYIKGDNTGVVGGAGFRGVQGTILSGTNDANAIAVYGNCANGRSDGRGVSGQAGTFGTGVYGYSPRGKGVHGVSITDGVGVLGDGGVRGNGHAGGVGVWANLPTTVGTTVYAENGNVGVGSAGANTAFYGWDGDGYLVSGAWLPFTGAHQGLFLKSSAVDEGDIIVDTEIIGDSSITDCIAINSISSASNQAAVGVFRRRGPLPTGVAEEGDNSRPLAKPSPLQSIPELEYEALLEDYDLIEINAVGEGLINVCDYNGDISVGDLIVTCPVAGKGAKQADDIVRSYTVARARQAVTWASEPGTTKLIPCIYLSG